MIEHFLSLERSKSLWTHTLVLSNDAIMFPQYYISTTLFLSYCLGQLEISHLKLHLICGQWITLMMQTECCMIRFGHCVSQPKPRWQCLQSSTPKLDNLWLTFVQSLMCGLTNMQVWHSPQTIYFFQKENDSMQVILQSQKFADALVCGLCGSGMKVNTATKSKKWVKR